MNNELVDHSVGPSAWPEPPSLLKLMQSYNIFSLCANNSAIIFS